MRRFRRHDLVAAALLGAVLVAGPASPEERCGADHPSVKDGQLKIIPIGQTEERVRMGLRNTDPSIAARNTTVLVTFWNAADQAIESTCVRLGDLRPGEEVEFEIAKPAGTAQISAGARSTWDR